jgi:hypothetical protein
MLRYPFPLLVISRIIRALIFKRPRSFHDDAQEFIQRLKPQLQISGLENIPAAGPFVVTANHYSAPGFGAWWIPLTISSIVPQEIHWLTTAELTFPHQKRGLILRPLSRWLLKRVAEIYGFTTMPAMPPDPRQSLERALSIRRLMKYIQTEPDGVIGLAPEGRDHLGGVLGKPPSGVGRFLLHLGREKMPFLPAAVFENEGSLFCSFGPPYSLQDKIGDVSTIKDEDLSKLVMIKIAALLPERFQGVY